MRRARVLSLFIFVCLLAGCSDDPSQPDPTRKSWIRGQVVDDQGAGVAGAVILMQYMKPDWDVPFYGNRANRRFQFDLPEAGHVKAWITNFCQVDTVRVLVDELLPAGIHIVGWDGHNAQGDLVVEGIYYFRVETDDVSQSYVVFLTYTTYSWLNSTEGLESFAVTNANGYFGFS